MKTKSQRQKVEHIQRDGMDMTQRSNPFTPDNCYPFSKKYAVKKKEKKRINVVIKIGSESLCMFHNVAGP